MLLPVLDENKKIKIEKILRTTVLYVVGLLVLLASIRLNAPLASLELLLIAVSLERGKARRG
jgi:hypothetical protein